MKTITIDLDDLRNCFYFYLTKRHNKSMSSKEVDEEWNIFKSIIGELDVKINHTYSLRLEK